MMNLEAVLATYIDINLLLIGTALLWCAARYALRKSLTGWAFATQLYLLKLVILAAFLFPIILTVFANIFGGTSKIPTTLSELVLAQYLQGNIYANPSFLESTLTLRQNLMTELSDFNHPAIKTLLFGAVITAAIMMFRAVLTGLKLRKILSSSHEWRGFGRLKFLVSDTVRIPFSTRTFENHYVVMPSYMLGNRADTKVALAHELQHLRQKDVDWEIIAAMLTPIFFWNPAFHYFRNQLEEIRELACDQSVLKRGFLTAKQYCECLLRVCEGRFQRPSFFQLRIPEVALVGTHMGVFGNRSKRLLENRLLSAVDPKVVGQSKVMIFLFASGLMFISGLLSFTVQKPTEWSHDRLMLSTIINLERLEERNRMGLGTYRSY